MAILREEEVKNKRPQFNFSTQTIKGFESPANFNAALEFLQTKTPEDITKLKKSKSKTSTEAKDDLYLSLYLANKALGKKAIEPKAEKILNKLKAYPSDEGNTNFHGKISKDLQTRWSDIKTSRSAQSTAKELTSPFKGEAPKQPEPQRAEPPKPETSTGTSAATAKTQGGESTTSPDIAPPGKKEQPAGEQPKIDLTKPVDPATATQRIQQLRTETSGEIQKIIDQLEKSEDLTAKLSLSKVLGLKKQYERKMDRYERNANAGPYSARKALNWAETDSGIAKHTAFKHTLKGTFRRGVQRVADTAQSMKQRMARTGQAIKKGVETSETLGKVREHIKPAMEQAKAGIEKGVEKMGQQYQGRVEKQREFIKNFAPDLLDAFNKAGPAGGYLTFRQAVARRNQAMRQAGQGQTGQAQPMQTQPIITPPPQQLQQSRLVNRRAGQKQLPYYRQGVTTESLRYKREVLMNYLNS
jgi:hypothetical protein